jgi:hypothetical protein
MTRRLVAAALLTLGCAPVAVLRPASGLADGREIEIGAGVATLGPRPYVEESTEVTAQLWTTIEPAEWLSLSAVTAFDDSALAGGIAARWNALRADRVALGLEAELGYAWAAGALTGAGRLFGESWLYAAPRLGTLGGHWAVGLPAGVSFEIVNGLSLRGEAQLSWVELKYYERRTHLAAAVAYQW